MFSWRCHGLCQVDDFTRVIQKLQVLIKSRKSCSVTLDRTYSVGYQHSRLAEVICLTGFYNSK